MDKKVFRDLSYGMYVVTSKSGDKKVGCIINTLTQVTSSNPIVTISLNKENYTSRAVKETKRFGVSIITEKIDTNIIATFGFSSSENTDKFTNVSYEEIDNMPVIKEGMSGYLICEVVDIIDAGTHDLFIAKVMDAQKLSEDEPMTYKYYHEVIKGKAPKKAPTYIEEEKTLEEEYVCDVCGYVHKGPLPDDFVCPVCGQDKSHFQKR